MLPALWRQLLWCLSGGPRGKYKQEHHAPEDNLHGGKDELARLALSAEPALQPDRAGDKADQPQRGSRITEIKTLTAS